MSEETNQTQPNEAATAPAEDSQVSQPADSVPVEWEAVRETYEMRQEQLRIEEYLSRFLLNTEKQKADLFARLSMLENHVYESASRLRDQLVEENDSAYELKMPDSPGEKAYFVRKQ